MSIVKQDLFAIPIYFTEYENCNELIDPVKSYINEIEENLVEYTSNGVTTYGEDNNVLDNLDFLHNLRDFIGNSVSEISNDIGLNSEVYFTGSWLTKNNKHSFHEPHNHLPDIWSGVYYVQANKNDAPITFLNNNFNDNWPYRRFTRETEYSYSTCSYPPETGRLVVFPAYLWHKVDQQIVEQDRITIAFNMKIR